ncbi:hypothetical protein PVAP13_1NG186919 [Panicum virgatum]|uniref:Uncharacterized protein n=1 Tax=Panicum virgatum TaxID=38727 RepID=A0A8T0WLX2_PANVG|nr:hypothetical protein PVAP13_1NG186919 [Panicum virgatum]
MDKGSATKGKRSARKRRHMIGLERDGIHSENCGHQKLMEGVVRRTRAMKSQCWIGAHYCDMADKDHNETHKPTEMATSEGDGMSRTVKESGDGEEIEQSHEELSNHRLCLQQR